MADSQLTLEISPDPNNSEDTTNARNKSNSEATKGKWSVLDKVLDPKGPILQKWNMIFAVSCVLSVLLDPLFLYIPILKDDMKCIGVDKNMKIVAVVLRSFTDLIYIVKIIFQIYKLEKCLPMGPLLLLVVHILAVLPIPQVVIIIFLIKMWGSRLNAIIMNSLVVLQYVPRVFCIYLACKEFKIQSSLEKWEPWLKGGLSFFMYILASNVFGALWYFFSIQRIIYCWQSACRTLSDHDDCKSSAFECHNQPTIRNRTLAYDLCPINPQNTTLFDFGIFINVLQSGIAGSTDYLQKLTNCLLWALRNLSSFGSNLQPSINAWENIFATSISIIGLLLFLYLIGKIQIYMGSETTIKEEERWKKEIQVKREIELKLRFEHKIDSWLHKNDLDRDRFKSKVEKEVVNLAVKSNKDDVDEREIFPNLSDELRDEIQIEKDAKEIHSWLEKHDLDPQHFKPQIVEEVKKKRKQNGKFDLDPNNILPIVPYNIRDTIMEHIYSYKPLAMLKQVRILQNMNEEELKKISKKLEPGTYPKSKFIIKEGKLLQMIFILDGVVSIEKRFCLESWKLKAGEIYGEKLLHWPSPTSTLDELPQATESVKADTDVVALILEAEAFRSMVSNYELHISKEITISSKYEIDKLSMLKKVPKLKKIDEKVLKAISEVLVPESYPRGKLIIEAQEKLDKMFLVTSGRVGVRFINKPRRKLYRAGELYGEELLHWGALDVFHTGTPSSDSSLPLSAGTATTDTKVDVLILYVTDLEKKMKELAATTSPPPNDSESED